MPYLTRSLSSVAPFLNPSLYALHCREVTMPRSKAPPRVKGPYCEREGSRFRIRICEATGHRDLYFSTRARRRLA